MKKYLIDAVISDNRFGMYHSSVPCIYVTHQLKIKTDHRFTEWIAQKINYWFINKYNECWVPDTAGEINLSGELSHPVVLPKVPVKYLGPLSRFEKVASEIRYDLLIILSGPEPQRTVFEEILLNDLKNYSGRALLVRGLPSNTTLLKPSSSSLGIQDHLPAAELNRVILQSQLIISRCGYTTVMDLIKLQKKAILVPTPGQTEQEYLADHLLKQKLFFCTKQEFFSLPEVLKKAEIFSFINSAFSQNDYEKVIDSFVLRFM
ncbi:MAG: glycosyltransferase [Ferruginibacter sp.]